MEAGISDHVWMKCLPWTEIVRNQIESNRAAITIGVIIISLIAIQLLIVQWLA